MTSCILPTDIELARRLVTASRTDDAIVAALVQRGVDSASAAQLVGDLRDGRPVAPQIPASLEIGPRRRSRSRRTARQSEPQQRPRVPEPNPHPEGAAEPRADNRNNAPTLWLIAAVPICFGAVIIGVLISNRLHRAAEEPQLDKPRTAMSPAGTNQTVPLAGAPDRATVRKPDAVREKLPAAGISNAPAP